MIGELRAKSAHGKYAYRLLELLVCPYDHRELKDERPLGLSCGTCKRTFPVINGIINFLAYDDSFMELRYDLPHHPVASVNAKNRLFALVRRLPIYHRLLVTSDHFSFVLERYLYKAVKKHKTVLDVGCREGTNLLYCGSSNNACVGIDIDLKSAHFAQQMSAPNAFGLLASGTQLPFADRSFDLVICCDVIEHVEEYEVLVKEMARVTQPQGELVLSTPDGDVRPKPAPYHVRHFRSNELVNMIEPAYSQLRLRSIVRNCQAKAPFWAFQDQYPTSRWLSIPLNAWTNLRYYLQGYNRPSGFRRRDVTDSTFILTAIKKPTG